MAPSTLSTIRKSKGQSITAFSKRLGISRNTLGLYEAGKAPIPKYIILATWAIEHSLDSNTMAMLRQYGISKSA